MQPDIVVAIARKTRKPSGKSLRATSQIDTNAPAATNNLLPFVDHTSEADLVRAKIKDGDQDENSVPPARNRCAPTGHPRPGPGAGGGLIKGLAVVRGIAFLISG